MVEPWTKLRLGLNMEDDLQPSPSLPSHVGVSS